LWSAAFQTSSGMPYGTVNLLRGVSPTETPVTCTAGVGTFILEFSALSRLTGDEQFEAMARQALHALWSTRSEIGLVPCLSVCLSVLPACLSLYCTACPSLYYPPVSLSVLPVLLSTTCLSLLPVLLSTTRLSLYCLSFSLLPICLSYCLFIMG